MWAFRGRMRPMSQRSIRVAVLSACMTVALRVPAQDKTEATLADARTALDDKRYAEAIRMVDPLRRAGPPSVRADALEITAVAALLLGKTEDGKHAVHELYDLEPAFELRDSSLPASVTGAFQAAEAEPHARRVNLRLEPAPPAPTAFDLSASGSVSEVRIACRVTGGKAFVPLTTARTSDTFRFQLPASRPHTCFALALDADGLLIGRLGSRAEPVEVLPRAPAAAPSARAPAPTAPAEPSAPLTSRWWFWTVLGTVALAGAVTIVAVAASGKSDAPGEQVGHKQGTILAW